MVVSNAKDQYRKTAGKYENRSNTRWSERKPRPQIYVSLLAITTAPDLTAGYTQELHVANTTASR